MKKLFLLPLMALLCLGCSKDAVMEAPKTATSQTARTSYESVDVVITNMINYSLVYSDSYVYYTDEYGNINSFKIDDGAYHALRVKKESAIAFRMKVWLNGSDKIYCAIRDESGGMNKILANFTDYGLSTGEFSIQVRELGLDEDGHETDVPKQIGVWASTDDFSLGQLD